MSNYVYQDKEATMPQLSGMLTSRFGDETGDHEALYIDAIKLLAAARGAGSAMDIGCGRGRITELIAPVVAEVVALEPDPGRCNWSREALAHLSNVSVFEQTTSDYIADNSSRQFDLTILGMVLQHMSTRYCVTLLDEVAQLTKPGGIAIVSTTHALEQAACFTYQHVADARISEEEFNAYAENSQAQDKGLPVHRFSRPELEALIPDAFTLVQWHQFSYYRPEHLEHFAQLHKVPARELENHGNSQFVVLKKR
ncbi:MAG: class I SAM-dependent methyltransferase [Gammaproteobacteria bacterium]|nr:class I SAM-dependent methyltransferase [Gammaproteobacteria bacterium]